MLPFQALHTLYQHQIKEYFEMQMTLQISISNGLALYSSYQLFFNLIAQKLLVNSFLGYTYEIFSSQTFFHHRTKLLNILVVNKSHEKLLFVIAARCNNIGYKNKMYMNDCVDNLFIDPNKLHFSTFFAFLSTIYIHTILSHTIQT